LYKIIIDNILAFSSATSSDIRLIFSSWRYSDKVCTHTLEFIDYLARRSLSESEHHDNREDTDNNTKHTESRAKLVAYYRIDGRYKIFLSDHVAGIMDL
jgi:hypothetical protein